MRDNKAKVMRSMLGLRHINYSFVIRRAHLIAQAMPLGKYTRPYSVLIVWSGLLAKLLRERVRVRARVRAGARECITFLSLFSCGLINVVNIFVGSVVSHGYLIRWRNCNVDRGELSLAQGRSGVGYREKEEINQPDTSAATCTVEQSKMLPGGSNDDKLTDVGTTSFVHNLIRAQPHSCLRRSASRRCCVRESFSA